MRIGFEVFERVSARYPLYRGGSVAGHAAEIFPHASACLLAGRTRPRELPRETFRRAVLSASGLATDQLTTLDQVDAALGALTGLVALDGACASVGDPNEGVILLPVARLSGPPVPTRAGRQL